MIFITLINCILLLGFSNQLFPLHVMKTSPLLTESRHTNWAFEHASLRFIIQWYVYHAIKIPLFGILCMWYLFSCIFGKESWKAVKQQSYHWFYIIYGQIMVRWCVQGGKGNLDLVFVVLLAMVLQVGVLSTIIYLDDNGDTIKR